MPDSSGAVIIGRPKNIEGVADALNNSIPAFGLAGCGVSLRFVVLPVLPDQDRFFVGLIQGHDAIPLCYADTFENAIEALDAISTGFLALGFRAGASTFIPDEH